MSLDIWLPLSSHERLRFSTFWARNDAYLVAAAGIVVEGQWEDPAYLRTLAATATPVNVSEKSIATVKLVTELERR